ncbi:MAG: alpha/beta hydrolase [Saprospiraceae bacterium]
MLTLKNKLLKSQLILLFSFWGLVLYAQQQYALIENINYYNDSLTQKDQYIYNQCNLDLYYPKEVKNFPTIVWFHGGGLTAGTKELPSYLMEKGCAVVGVEYRLSPKVQSPAYIEDAAAALAWVFNHIEKYGGRKDLIFLSGHSAGAYLGMMVTFDKKYLQKYNIDANQIAGLIPFSGQAITHFTIRKEKGLSAIQPVIDEFAPLYFVKEETPPILLITGDRELELYGRYEENAYLLRMFKLTGNKKCRLYELQGFDHGTMPEPAFPLLMQEVNKITRQVLKK